MIFTPKPMTSYESTQHDGSVVDHECKAPRGCGWATSRTAPAHASVTSPDFNASSEDCDVTYGRVDDTGIDATFSCVVDEFHWLTAGDPPDRFDHD